MRSARDLNPHHLQCRAPDGMETPATRAHPATFTPYDSAEGGRRDSLGISPGTLHKVGTRRPGLLLVLFVYSFFKIFVMVCLAEKLAAVGG